MVESHHRKDRAPLLKVLVHNRFADERHLHRVEAALHPNGRISSFRCLRVGCGSSCVRLNYATWVARPCPIVR